MRKSLIVSSLLLVICLTTSLATLFMATMVGAEEKTKQPMVISEAEQPAGFPGLTPVGEVVVKEYPVYRSATVTSSAAKQNSMFRTLFGHIKKNEISMTSPVEMTYGEDGRSSMSFLYATPEIGELGKDGLVEVRDVPSAQFVSIGVRGKYSQENFREHCKILNEWLEQNKNQWIRAGQSRYLAFNSPFVPNLMKYGEVQVPVRAVESP